MASKQSYIDFFNNADVDKSGTLTLDELILILKKQGFRQTDEEIKHMFASVDTSGDGVISLDEYLVAMGEQPPAVQGMAAMRRVFLDFDKDGNGKIDKNELKTVFKELGKYFSDDELTRMMAQFDDDGSGDMDYEEFLKHIFNVDPNK